MRVLTVRQPWAWAIVHGGKDVENRTRNIAGTYRGPVAIHAGLTEADLDPDDPMYGLVHRRCPDGQTSTHNEYACHWCSTIAPRRYVDHGRIIGVVDLIDVHAGWIEPQGKPCSPWGIDYIEHVGQHHLVLANPRALATPIPAKGRLGLWRPDADLERAITDALATVREEVNP